MARISNTTNYPQDQNLENNDFLVGTDVGDSNATKSYTLEDLRGFITDGLGAALPTEIPLGFACLLYTSPSPRDATLSRMPSSA